MSYIAPVLLLDAQTIDETTSKPVFVAAAKRVTFWVRGNGTTSSGVLTIEECLDSSYTGTWSALTTVNASGVTGNQEQAVHVDLGAGQYVRVRITTVIGGGGSLTVSVSGL